MIEFESAIPPRHIRRKHHHALMHGRAKLKKILPKIIALTLMQLDEKQIKKAVPKSKNIVEFFLQVADVIEDDLALDRQELAHLFGILSDLNQKTQWDPAPQLPFQTEKDIIRWFAIYVKTHLEDRDLAWDGKTGESVLNELKLML